MTNIVAASAHGGRAPSFRVRVELPARALADYGVGFEFATLLGHGDEERFRDGAPQVRAWVLANAHRRLRRQLAHVSGPVLVQRQVDLLPSMALERRVARAQRLVYDVDDAIWNATDPAAGGHALAALKRSGYKAGWLAARADQVIAGNAYLAEWLDGHTTAPISIVPSLVDVDAIPVRVHADAEVVRLGWIGSATTRPHLDLVTSALEQAARALPDRTFRLDIVGGGQMDVQGVDVRAIPWSEQTEAQLLAEMDIGLMPLPDTPWTRGKCAYKAQQYMAAGVPVVADDVGVSGRVIGDGRAGLIPVGSAAWADALVSLATDVSLRTRLGTEGRARAVRDFSVTTRAPELARLITG